LPRECCALPGQARKKTDYTDKTKI
jgi:hypothetical protein